MSMWFKCSVLQGFRNDVHAKHKENEGSYFPKWTWGEENNHFEYAHDYVVKR